MRVISACGRPLMGMCLLMFVVLLWVSISFLGSVGSLHGLLEDILMSAGHTKRQSVLEAVLSDLHHVNLPNTSLWSFTSSERMGKDRSEISQYTSSWIILLEDLGGVRLPTEDTGNGISPHQQSSMSEHASLLGRGLDIFHVRHELGLRNTAKFAIRFCPFWLTANLLAMYCLRYTTVASATIITSTSTIWTLLISAVAGVQEVTICNMCGVVASLLGISVIAHVDVSKDNLETIQNTLLGDGMALVCAIAYSIYAVSLKRRLLDGDRVDVTKLYALVGLFTAMLAWPLFIILDRACVEKFEFPPSADIATIVIMIAVFSMASDICWAYAISLLSPLTATVGLRLTIPLTLIGEVRLHGRHLPFLYWAGASAVVGGLLLVSYGDIKSKECGEGLHNKRTNLSVLAESTS